MSLFKKQGPPELLKVEDKLADMPEPPKPPVPPVPGQPQPPTPPAAPEQLPPLPVAPVPPQQPQAPPQQEVDVAEALYKRQALILQEIYSVDERLRNMQDVLLDVKTLLVDLKETKAKK